MSKVYESSIMGGKKPLAMDLLPHAHRQGRPQSALHVRKELEGFSSRHSLFSSPLCTLRLWGRMILLCVPVN